MYMGVVNNFDERSFGRKCEESGGTKMVVEVNSCSSSTVDGGV